MTYCTNPDCEHYVDDGEPELRGTTFLCDACEEARWTGVLEEPFHGTPIPAADIPFQVAA